MVFKNIEVTNIVANTVGKLEADLKQVMQEILNKNSIRTHLLLNAKNLGLAPIN